MIFLYEEYECPGDEYGVFVAKSAHSTEEGARAEGQYLGSQNEGRDWRVLPMELEK